MKMSSVMIVIQKENAWILYIIYRWAEGIESIHSEWLNISMIFCIVLLVDNDRCSELLASFSVPSSLLFVFVRWWLNWDSLSLVGRGP